MKTAIESIKKKRSIEDSLKALSKRWKDQAKSEEKPKAITKEFGRIIVILNPSNEKDIENVF